jgi:hypothetical protein
MTRSLRRLRRFAFTASLTALASTIPLRAAKADPSPEARAEARSRFDRGIHLFEEGNYAVALSEFKRAYEIAPHPTVLYNLALAYAALNDSVHALDALDKLLSDASVLSADQIARANKAREEQAARVGEIDVKVVLKGAPEGANARVEIDNVEAGQTPLSKPLRISAGNHIVSAYAAGYAPSRKPVTIAGKTKTELAFDLAPLEGRLAHLTVITHVPGAEVTANGDAIGKTPLDASVTLAPGNYHIELKRPGYLVAKSDVTLGDGATGSVALEPEEDPARPTSLTGVLALKPSEDGAVVSIDGRMRGVYTGPLPVPVGLHHVKVDHAGFFATERDVVVEPGRPVELAVPLQPTNETRASYESGAKSRRLWGWILAGAGVAVTAGATGFVIWNQGKQNDAQKTYDDIVASSVPHSGLACDPSGAGNHDLCKAQFDDADANLSDIKTRGIIGFVALGVGVVSLGTGAYLLIAGEDPHKYDRVGTVLERVRLRPLATRLPGGGLVGLGGEF